MDKMINKKNFKTFLIIYLIVLFVVLIFVTLVLLERLSNRNDFHLDNVNNIIIRASDSNDVVFTDYSRDGYEDELKLYNDTVIGDKYVKTTDNCNNFYALKNNSYEYLNNKEKEDYLISFNFRIKTKEIVNVSLDNDSFVKEYINDIEISRINNIRIGFFLVCNIYKIKTSKKEIEINLPNDYYLDNEVNSYMYFNDYKVSLIRVSNGEFIKIKLSNDEEIEQISITDKDYEELVSLWVPYFSKLNINKEDLINIDTSKITKDKDFSNVINNSEYHFNTNRLVNVKIWYEKSNIEELVDFSDIKTLIVLSFSVNKLKSPNEEELRKLNSVYYRDGYLYLEEKMIDNNIFKLLYSYDGIDYSYYNKAILRKNYDHVYLKTMNNNEYMSSKAIILYYGNSLE